MKQPESTPKPKWREGDVVEIIAERRGHGFMIGERVTIKEYDSNDEGYRCKDLSGNSFWVWEDEAVLVDKNSPAFNKQDMIDFAWFVKESLGQTTNDKAYHFAGGFFDKWVNKNK